MAVFMRSKSVTAPLDDKVKARLRGDDSHQMTGCASSSSGSEHGADACFSGLVHDFLLESAADVPSAAGDASDHGDTDDDDHAGGRAPAAAAVETVWDLLHTPAEKDPFRARLVTDVLTAAEAFAGFRKNGSAFRRAVMATLRKAGYNAGICKSRWETSGGVAAGSYEYIDVVAAAGKAGEVMRYIVDLEFAAEFQVARATEEYGRLLAALPQVAVATPEAVRQVVRVVADAARRSLRSRRLHVPPWRKSWYMRAKWLGSYRRTVNPVSASAGAPVGVGGADVKCRAVGFQAAAAAEKLVPPAARTR